MMRITFLGTGTSHGVPMLGCSCPVCLSTDPRDKRYRSSILIEQDGCSVIIDTGYEFRLQCLRAHVGNLSGVLYTHAHSDHLMGLDDLRVFTRDSRMNIYSFQSILDEIKLKFPYAFIDKPNHGLPQLDCISIDPYEHFKIGNTEFTAIPVYHGDNIIAGYRFGSVAYITDVSNIMLDVNLGYLKNLDVLIIGALREKPHPTHYSFSEAAAVAKEINAKRTFFTHMNHSLSHVDISVRYKGIAMPAYDGLVLEV